MATTEVHDAHRHLGLLPAHPFYGDPAINADLGARASLEQLLDDLDAEGAGRALVLPSYGVPGVSISFAHNDLVLDAAARDDRVRCGLWVSPPASSSRACG